MAHILLERNVYRRLDDKRMAQLKQGLAIAIISTGGGIGSFAFPFAIAALADYWGIERAFWAYAFTAVAMSASAAAALVWIRRANTSHGV